jgi:hypothetical protein
LIPFAEISRIFFQHIWGAVLLFLEDKRSNKIES